MKPLFFLFAAGLTNIEGPFFSVVIVVAALVMVLNQLGLMPKGRTAERLKLDLDVSEKELARQKIETARLEALLKVEESRPDYRELVHLMIDHDKRMMEQGERIADKLNALTIAIIPPLP